VIFHTCTQYSYLVLNNFACRTTAINQITKMFYFSFSLWIAITGSFRDGLGQLYTKAYSF